MLIEVVQLWNASQLSPLAGWPHEWAAWVVEGVLALESAMSARTREKLDNG